jgi:hypothetical protein
MLARRVLFSHKFINANSCSGLQVLCLLVEVPDAFFPLEVRDHHMPRYFIPSTSVANREDSIKYSICIERSAIIIVLSLAGLYMKCAISNPWPHRGQKPPSVC